MKLFRDRASYGPRVTVVFVALIALCVSVMSQGCTRTRPGIARVMRMDSVALNGRGPREFYLRFIGNSGMDIPAGGKVTARVRGEIIPLEYGIKGYAGYEDSIEISVVTRNYELLYAVLPPVSASRRDTQEVHVFQMQEPGREFHDGPEGKIEYVSYGSYIHVTPSTVSTPERVRQLFDSLGLRRLTGNEMGALGIFKAEMRDDGTQRHRLLPLRDGDAGPIIVVNARGGIFDRLNSPELRSLRSSSLIESAGPYVGYWEGGVRSYSNRLRIMVSGADYEKTRSFLLQNGFRIVNTFPVDTPTGIDDYNLLVRTDDGVGRGLWEVLDWLRRYAGIRAGLYEAEWNTLNHGEWIYTD